MAEGRRRGIIAGNQAVETIEPENTPGTHRKEMGSAGGILNRGLWIAQPRGAMSQWPAL
jgi:hypothetical protein